MNWLVTGGAGFIGTNMANSLLCRGENVAVFDNFSRHGSQRFSSELYPDCRIIKGDLRHYREIELAVSSIKPDIILHLAAQVAVTVSVENPRYDFDCNALGTFNLLEAARHHSPECIFLNASTNKVYGEMKDIPIVEHSNYYSYAENFYGISENQHLNFHSPYGCSKGAAEQYVIDYARIYGIRSVNFRQSCIYGPDQFGIEDQGWVAWMTIASLTGKPITFYGNGKQVRDILYVADVLELYYKAVERIDSVSGKTFNVGGGLANTMSLFQLIHLLETFTKKPIKYRFGDERPGDQKIYVSNISKAERLLDWKPSVSTKEGVKKLFKWVSENKKIF